MSIANSSTRRAEPRTAKDLEARGYKIIALNRFAGGPMAYKLVAVARIGFNGGPMAYKAADDPADDRWLALIEGPPTRAQAFTPTKRGGFRKRPMSGGPFESIVAAAHAVLDAEGVS